MKSDRKPRIARAIRDNLSDLISSELTDPRIREAGLVSINHIELNADTSVATVYVSLYGADAGGYETVSKFRVPPSGHAITETSAMPRGLADGLRGGSSALRATGEPCRGRGPPPASIYPLKIFFPPAALARRESIRPWERRIPVSAGAGCSRESGRVKPF